MGNIGEIQERVRELEFLNSLSVIFCDPRDSLEHTFQQVIHLIIESWINPVITSVKISYGQIVFTSKGFIQSQLSDSTKIFVNVITFPKHSAN